jgi:prepilin-type N-terminal cleavage/methylation domain-containing protein
MPNSVNSKQLTVNRQNKTVHRLLSTVYHQGYSLIELLVVIAIFGITISLVTAAYLTFERNQRFKNAALQLKNDVRYAQNQALSGVMGADSGAICPKDATHVLGGWYVTLSLTSPTTYKLSGLCLTIDATSGDITSQTVFGTKNLNFPKGINVSGISSGTDTSIFFQPLSQNAIFTTSTPGNSTPSTFFNADGTWRANSVSAPLTISLNSSSAALGTYNVVVQSTGEVNENKLP